MPIWKTTAHLLIILFLTFLTQIGGIIWGIVFYSFSHLKPKLSKVKRLLIFATVYSLISLFLLPKLAKFGDRERLPISQNSSLAPHNYFTVICNRNYVKTNLKSALANAANQYAKGFPNQQITYLDANFPFFDGFPLLPHLSHNDGRKIDLSFQYLKENNPTNLKPSRSGYGVFVSDEKVNQALVEKCKRSNSFYDYSKYFTFGSRKNLEFDATRTKKLIHLLLQEKSTHKIFIEPHLKNSMKLSDPRIRYQGCHSVRHDDHIHWQVL